MYIELLQSRYSESDCKVSRMSDKKNIAEISARAFKVLHKISKLKTQAYETVKKSFSFTSDSSTSHIHLAGASSR